MAGHKIGPSAPTGSPGGGSRAGAARRRPRPGGARRGGLRELGAAGARDVARLVRAPLPEQARGLLVAAEAGGVAPLDGRRVVLGEADDPADALAAARVRVRLAGAVSALAAEALRGVARVLEEEAG